MSNSRLSQCFDFFPCCHLKDLECIAQSVITTIQLAAHLRRTGLNSDIADILDDAPGTSTSAMDILIHAMAIVRLIIAPLLRAQPLRPSASS
jgi:hypothetical protein